jgi:hypothetical protein
MNHNKRLFNFFYPRITRIFIFSYPAQKQRFMFAEFGIMGIKEYDRGSKGEKENFYE